MKTLVFTLTLTLALQSFAQYPPNGDLETWGDYGQFYDSPEHWITSNLDDEQAVFQESDSYSGEYAMRVKSMSFENGLVGEARCGFPVSEPFTILQAQVKAVINGIAQVNVYLEYWEGETLIGFDNWYSNESINEWEQMEILVPDVNPDSVVILVSALGGDFAFGESEITIDSFWMDMGANGIQSGSMNECSVTFDANRQLLIINSDHSIDQCSLYNLSGQLVSTYDINAIQDEIDMSDTHQGTYILKWNSEYGYGTSKVRIVR